MTDGLPGGWSDWRGVFPDKPRVMRKLSGGRTNHSYLIEARGRRYVLRLSATPGSVPGIDRHREIKILEHAAAAGIAPALVYHSIEQGVTITEYLDGSHWTPATVTDVARLKSFINLLHRVHTLPLDTAPLDYPAQMASYWQLIDAANVTVPAALRDERTFLLKHALDLTGAGGSRVCCHHDVTPHNLIEYRGRLYLLDWEYAAPGLAAFDYATLHVEWHTPVAALTQHADLDVDTITYAVRLYRHLCRLWELTTAHARATQTADP